MNEYTRSRIMKRFASGESVRSLADLYGVEVKDVEHIIRMSELKPPTDKELCTEQKCIRFTVAQSNSIREISGLMNVTESSVVRQMVDFYLSQNN